MNVKNLIAILLSVILIIGAVAFAADSTPQISEADIDAILNTTTDASKISSPFTEVSDKVRDSVVGINNYQIQRNNYYNYYGFGFGYGYGNRGNNNESQETLYAKGSGVVVTPYGHVLTNYHVIEDASRITVTIAADDKEYDAQLISYSEDEDVAVLLVKDLPVQAVELGDSDSLQVGEWAIVIGNPLSDIFARTVTVGIVSALDRAITDSSYDRYGRRTNITNNMIQVDAAINSGNSGGGMFNTLGQLMGIPARKYSSSGSFNSASIENIGMCIPINVAKPYIREALEKYNGSAIETENSRNGINSTASNRVMLGVTVFTQTNVSDVLPNGAIVSNVNDNSNAKRGGIQVGDVIVEVNDTMISSSTDLVNFIQTCKENDTLSIKVYRAPGMDQAITDKGLDLTNVEREYSEDYYITLTVVLLNDKAA
jgi:serine protease Do